MKYYVNKVAQPNGDHEVHKATCGWLPNASNRLYLGDFVYSSSALREARKYYTHVDGCYLRSIIPERTSARPLCGRADSLFRGES